MLLEKETWGRGKKWSGEVLSEKYVQRAVYYQGGGGAEAERFWWSGGGGAGGGGLDVNFDSEKTELSFSELKPK